jgi:shikimate kinase/3-dehydroquinate synthase
LAALATGRDGSARALVFIGFMGSGKSKAVLAAAAAGLEAVDADRVLTERLGTSIDAFFAAQGEAEFRRREEEIVGELLERAEGGAIALGGGSVLSERVRTALGRHTVVWLDAEIGEAWSRVEGSARPLAADHVRFAELYAERRPIYESLADAVVPGRREAVRRSLPALRALSELPAGFRLAWATSASGDYPAFVGRGLLGESPLGRAAAHGEIGLGGRPFCITDETVDSLYGGRLEHVAGRIAVGPGEGAKTLGEAERVLRELAGLGMTREDHILALGGGVVGDLAGFCAATYQRGVAVVQIPTTLVAQVDSAYGGKTGVDLPEAKNYVGAYHQPAAVLADPATLGTLPAAELAAGFVEVVKTALIAGGALWERVRAIETLDPEALDEVIFACARTKLAVVAADERDSGGREALNLGHTVGHAIETASDYSRYRHGEAVGLGLLAALELSGAGDLRDEVEAILTRTGLPTRLDRSIGLDDLVAAIGRDKKRTAEGVGFVLCPRPGEVVTGQLVDPDKVRAAVQSLVDTG